MAESARKGPAPRFVQRSSRTACRARARFPHAIRLHVVSSVDAPSRPRAGECLIPPGSRYYVDSFGDDNLVFSTDYPHGDSKFPAAVAAFLELPLRDETKRKVLWDNWCRLYGMPSDVTIGENGNDERAQVSARVGNGGPGQGT